MFEKEEVKNEIIMVEEVATNREVEILELEVEELLGTELIREHLSNGLCIPRGSMRENLLIEKILW